MPGLVEQALRQAHTWAKYPMPYGGRVSRFELNEPDRMVLKLKDYGGGRITGVVRWVNVQRVLDLTDGNRVVRGSRVAPEERDESNIARSQVRARKTVSDICQAMAADRLVTFTTRAMLPLSVLLARFERFKRAYQRALDSRAKELKQDSMKWRYVMVPEQHPTNLEHFHLHVATHGWFDLGLANRLWWALCACDMPEHKVNGNIDVRMFKRANGQTDIPGRIASYIGKYVGKALEAGFNKKSYWASRGNRVAVMHRILRSASWLDAQRELTEMLGVSWASLALTHEGCLFVFPGDTGFWFKCLPDMHRPTPF